VGGLARALVDLQALTERLRRECPWDRAQTARTIVPHTVEEAYEVADAALADDDEKLLDELGDLLFQAFFLALTLQEKGYGDLAEAARRVHEKLVRRHPHVFLAAGELRSAGAVKRRWEELKTEQEAREGIFHHVPDSLPALLLAKKAQRRAAAVGFEYPDARGALADLEDELEELRREVPESDPPSETEPEPRVAAEIGDVLFACVNVARRVNADPELELRRATARFVERVEEADRLARVDGLAFAELPLEEQDRFFDRAKEAERG
jgi:nucleoside triphosphate diphosphatase